jgi:hypothetical protein
MTMLNNALRGIVYLGLGLCLAMAIASVAYLFFLNSLDALTFPYMQWYYGAQVWRKNWLQGLLVIGSGLLGLLFLGLWVTCGSRWQRRSRSRQWHPH